MISIDVFGITIPTSQQIVDALVQSNEISFVGSTSRRVEGEDGLWRKIFTAGQHFLNDVFRRSTLPPK